jgi:hypothetical protein
VAKNSNADNDYWEEYRRYGKDFRGSAEELEDLATEDDKHVRIERKKQALRYVDESGN